MTPDDSRIKEDKKKKKKKGRKKKEMGKGDEGGWESSFGLVSADHCGDPPVHHSRYILRTAC